MEDKKVFRCLGCYSLVDRDDICDVCECTEFDCLHVDVTNDKHKILFRDRDKYKLIQVFLNGKMEYYITDPEYMLSDWIIFYDKGTSCFAPSCWAHNGTCHASPEMREYINYVGRNLDIFAREYHAQ